MLSRGHAAAALVLFSLPAVGRGWLNGDAAAYCAQIGSGDWTDRWTHVGYVVLAAPLAFLGDSLPVALDCLGVLAGVVAALAAGTLGKRPWLASAGAAAALLPWAPFAEVDPVWIALVVLSAAGVPGAMALAVTVSPVALLAVAWVSWYRGRAPWLEALGVVLLLTAVSGGAWWVGERGVLTGPGLMVGRTAMAWAFGLPWLLGAALALDPRRAAPLVGLLPLMLAPPDVPTWALGGVAVAVAVSGIPTRRWLLGLVAVEVLLGGLRTQSRASRVAAERAVVEAVAAAWLPNDGMEAPFTWGARVSVAVSGSVYGVPWHPPEGWLRQQRDQWCAAPPSRVVVLPPVDGTVQWSSARISSHGCPPPAAP